MRGNRFVQKVTVALLAVLLCLSSLAVCPALASTPTARITITTRDLDKKEVVGGAVYRLYAFATATISDSNVSFAYTDAFKNNGMSLDRAADASLALHLSVYAENHELPYTEKAADDNGVVTFDNLPVGAYLVVPTEIAQGYIPASPLIVCLPKMVNGEWQYTEECTPKIQEENGTPETVSVAVQKKWVGSATHPDNVTVSLIQDSKTVDVVSLNTQNDWYYEWTELDGNHAWNVVEPNVPTDYRASYETSERLVIITNTGTTTVPPDEEPPLLQTGQLNWPVPILLMAGLVLILIGWAMLNFSNKDEETV